MFVIYRFLFIQSTIFDLGISTFEIWRWDQTRKRSIQIYSLLSRLQVLIQISVAYMTKLKHSLRGRKPLSTMKVSTPHRNSLREIVIKITATTNRKLVSMDKDFSTYNINTTIMFPVVSVCAVSPFYSYFLKVNEYLFRNCIGQNFALNEEKVMIGSLVKR